MDIKSDDHPTIGFMICDRWLGAGGAVFGGKRRIAKGLYARMRYQNSAEAVPVHHIAGQCNIITCI